MLAGPDDDRKKEKLVAFVTLLNACARKKDLQGGIRLHADILKSGLLRWNPRLGSALVAMFAKCDALAEARRALRDLPFRDVACWNALIAGYSEHGLVENAVNCLEQLQNEGLCASPITFTCILKACGCAQKLHVGRQIHEEVLNAGILGKDAMLGNALVDMYVKCGDVETAKQVLEELPRRDVVTWSCLIAGYARQGLGENALMCFDQMQKEALSPNVITFTCVLKACASVGALEKGKQIHGDIVQKGLLGQDVILGTVLVDMYARCGDLVDAEHVLGELPDRDVVCWSVMISGYVQQGHGREALRCLGQMRREGFSLDAVTYNCILKACGDTGEICMGKRVHGEVMENGFLKDNVVLGNALVDMYAKCREMTKAKQVLHELPGRNVITWSALISGYSQQEGCGEDALACFEKMRIESVSPSAVTYACVLKASGYVGALNMGKKIHNEMVHNGGLLLEEDAVLGTALVDMYARCSELETAFRVLDALPVKKNSTTCWNALISGFTQQGRCNEALNCFELMMMQKHGPSPNAVTFTCILKACGSTGAVARGEQIHDQVASRKLLGRDITLQTALIDMYAKCGLIAKARQVLDELPARDVVAWNALISGYAQKGQDDGVLDCLGRMQKDRITPNATTLTYVLKICGDSTRSMDEVEAMHDEMMRKGVLLPGDAAMVATALIGMYGRAGTLSKARELLLLLDTRLAQNAVSCWNALIAGYGQHGQGKEAMDCLERMQEGGVAPTAVTFLCLLNACSHSGMVEEGRMYFERMGRVYGVTPNAEHEACMVDMLGRAGHFEEAMEMVGGMPWRDYGPVWGAVMGACKKWGNVALGRLAFERAASLQESNAASYVCMANICLSSTPPRQQTPMMLQGQEDAGKSLSKCD